MDTHVREAHEALDAEVHRLSAEYQRACHAAALVYQDGLQRAQADFEARLREIAAQLTKSMHEAMSAAATRTL